MLYLYPGSTMETDHFPAPSSKYLPGGKVRVTTANAHLQARYRSVGLVTLGIPALGTLAALGLLAFQPLRLLDVALLLGMYVLTVFGLEVGYHRHFAHGAFKASPPVRVSLAVLGGMAASGPLVYWAATHRLHHHFPDEPGDPHSPYLKADRPLGRLPGLWHAHTGWMLDSEITNCALLARDLLRDLDVSRLSRRYYLWVLLGLLLPALVGGLASATWMGALQGLLWGGMVRIFLVHQLYIGALNSVCHLLGDRPFATGDLSTNNAWLALPTLGESWHNNHHAFCSSAVTGLEWWQIDPSGWCIRLLAAVGLVWEVKIPSQATIAARRQGR
ncbi:MAG: acyl-CoA desaturase [Aphanocapsa lilacina HA4352-LM1]|jgi:stearoyl-CoA desaturase (delta-9 desaturase)|nr:acyl-CoA desaturase [Aphanocapsa lilacina HA4352-LM1]